MRTPEELVSTVAKHNRGHAPNTLMAWLRVAGSAGLSVRVADLGPAFRGAIRGGVIVVPDVADEAEVCSVIAHEVIEHLLVMERHTIALQAEAMLRSPSRSADHRPTPDMDQWPEDTTPLAPNTGQSTLRRRRSEELPRLLPRRCAV